MPPRVILGEIDGNRCGKELTSHMGGQIIGYHGAGWGYQRIATQLKIPKSTVRNTIIQHPFRNGSASQPCTGRPSKLSDCDQRALIHYVQAESKLIYQSLLQNSALEVSRSTIYRTLKAVGITNHPSKKRPFLLPIHAEKQLAWAIA